MHIIKPKSWQLGQKLIIADQTKPNNDSPQSFTFYKQGDCNETVLELNQTVSGPCKVKGSKFWLHEPAQFCYCNCLVQLNKNRKHDQAIVYTMSNYTKCLSTKKTEACKLQFFEILCHQITVHLYLIGQIMKAMTSLSCMSSRTRRVSWTGIGSCYHSPSMRIG